MALPPPILSWMSPILQPPVSARSTYVSSSSGPLLPGICLELGDFLLSPTREKSLVHQFLMFLISSVCFFEIEYFPAFSLDSQFHTEQFRVFSDLDRNFFGG